MGDGGPTEGGSQTNHLILLSSANCAVVSGIPFATIDVE